MKIMEKRFMVFKFLAIPVVWLINQVAEFIIVLKPFIAMFLWLAIIISPSELGPISMFLVWLIITDYIKIVVTKCNAEAKPEFHSMFSGYSDAGATFRSLLPKKTKSK